MNKESKSFPTLTTERLTLRQLSESDAGGIFELRSNPEINKFLDRKPSQTIEDALNFIKNITENKELFYWAITKTGEDKLVGTICLFEFLSNESKCEIGYELLTEYQGQGFMFEAANGIIEFATKTLGIKTIEAVTHKDNQSSTGLLLKLDFKESGNIYDENPNLILFRLTI
ncbi:MAG TPA: GNAT family N-acetyltransferase [Flavobacterium sp.]|uniref:GNAT family N-acetyltransferase n=1 Tax=Flavobacterium sp. TaxID=239 RepID=UPI002BF39381|nr:GNAT family N-acetyltransferase [Flavobacterium sp.]HNP33684.1 GNAT family N-acetyltransferase [Flavobacterium sp.]